MKQFDVTWGEYSETVFAADESEAWSKFADSNRLAQRHPRLHERKVEDHKPVDSTQVNIAHEPTKRK